MSNPNGKPPVPSKELNPLQGLSISKIDHYGLGGVVKRLVNAGNKVPAIHEEIHKNHLPPDAPKISIMAIHRWIKKNIGDDYVDGRLSEDQAINTYHEECQLLQTINDQVSLLEIIRDELVGNLKGNFDVKSVLKDTKELSFSLDKMVTRKQALLVNIKDTQEKIYNFANFQEVMSIILGIVKERDLMLHAEIIEKIKSNAFLQEFYRKIATKE